MLKKAQSTLEYALIFPILFLMILGILELAMMWHQYNSIEMVADEISANIVLSDNFGCVGPEKAMQIVQDKTDVLQEKKLTFSPQNENGVVTFTSNERYKENPFVVVKIDCLTSGVNSGKYQQAPSVQIQAVHRLHFFAASLPNFKTGKRIVIIPDNVVFVSKKVITLGQY